MEHRVIKRFKEERLKDKRRTWLKKFGRSLTLRKDRRTKDRRYKAHRRKSDHAGEARNKASHR
jgi:hypothetical protein